MSLPQNICCHVIQRASGLLVPRLLAGELLPAARGHVAILRIEFNVPNDKFGKSYAETFVAAMKWIVQADRSKFVCANERYFLARDFVSVCWPCAQCDRFINAAAELWNDW